ncbi:hypothetical protein LguiB_001001 [Lonicera macranthoides]
MQKASKRRKMRKKLMRRTKRHSKAQRVARLSKLKDCNALQRNSSFSISHKSKEVGVTVSIISAGLPETAASIAFAAMVVGAAGTLLVRRTKASEATKAPSKICGNCGGSGICPECRGEGFVPKKLSDGSAEKARLTAKNMATRHTASNSSQV